MACCTSNIVETLVFYSQLLGLNRHWLDLVHPLSVNYFFHSRNKVGPIVSQHGTNAGNQQSISYIGLTFNRSSQSAECHDFCLGCDSLLKREENNPFSKRIINRDKNRLLTTILNENNRGLGVLHVYCRQLDELNSAIKQKRPELMNRKGVVFQHDNVRLHISLVTCQEFLQFGWDAVVRKK